MNWQLNYYSFLLIVCFSFSVKAMRKDIIIIDESVKPISLLVAPVFSSETPFFDDKWKKFYKKETYICNAVKLPKNFLMVCDYLGVKSKEKETKYIEKSIKSLFKNHRKKDIIRRKKRPKLYFLNIFLSKEELTFYFFYTIPHDLRLLFCKYVNSCQDKEIGIELSKCCKKFVKDNNLL